MAPLTKEEKQKHAQTLARKVVSGSAQAAPAKTGLFAKKPAAAPAPPPTANLTVTPIASIAERTLERRAVDGTNVADTDRLRLGEKLIVRLRLDNVEPDQLERSGSMTVTDLLTQDGRATVEASNVIVFVFRAVKPGNEKAKITVTPAGTTEVETEVRVHVEAALENQGGKVVSADLEHDMHDILKDWQTGALEGVGQFVTNALTARIDKIESGSWDTFMKGLIGNVVWAAAVFLPGAEVAAFALSLAGIALGAEPGIPRPKSDDAIPKVQRMYVTYINTYFNGLVEQVGSKAAALVDAHPTWTRYHAVAEMVRTTFKPDVIHVDEYYARIPQIDQTAVANHYEKFATDRLELLKDIGTFVDGHNLWGELPDDSYVEEVAWVEAPSFRKGKRLALLYTVVIDGGNDVRKGTERTVIRWIPAEQQEFAISQWSAKRNGALPATYPMSKVHVTAELLLEEQVEEAREAGGT
jgi:hypothetical protein